MSIMQELDENVVEKIALDRFEFQLRTMILNEIKPGEINILDNFDVVWTKEIPKLEKYRSDLGKHQKAFSRIIYEQYLHKVIKDITNQIFQERPSLP